MSSKKSLYPDKPMYIVELDKKALVYMSILTFGVLFLLGSMFRHYPMGGMQINAITLQLENSSNTLHAVYAEFSDLNENIFELNKNLERIGNNLERIANQMQQVMLMMESMLLKTVLESKLVDMTSSFLDKLDEDGVSDDAREVIKPMVQSQIKHNPNILRVLELLNNELNNNDQVGHSYVQLFIARIRSEYETKEFEGDD